MSVPEVQEQGKETYFGDPNDVILARRKYGVGVGFFVPNQYYSGPDEVCTCHPGASLPAVHEGEIITLRRGEVIGEFFPDTGLWSEGRSDFEYAGEIQRVEAVDADISTVSLSKPSARPEKTKTK